MIDLIRKAALGAVEAQSPLAIRFGTVLKTNPLEVNVDQRFTLDADFLVVPESLTRLEVELSHTHGSGPEIKQKVVIRPGLEAGDQVILLRVQGGQQYIILDKVAST